MQVWFALEEKNIPYDTVLINLQNKPEWFKKLVPTQLVPAVKINGELVYESYDILMVWTLPVCALMAMTRCEMDGCHVSSPSHLSSDRASAWDSSSARHISPTRQSQLSTSQHANAPHAFSKAARMGHSARSLGSRLGGCSKQLLPDNAYTVG